MQVRYRSPFGEPRISVTQVLTLAGRIDTQWFTPEACARGHRVHEITEQIDRNEPFVVEPAYAGYIEAYLSFLAIVRPAYRDVELEVQSAQWELGGRIDRVVESIWGEAGILDIKTGDPQEWHKQQLAAYNAMHPTGARWGLYLTKTGRYYLRRYDDGLDYRKFFYDLAQVRGTIYADGDHWVAA